MACVVEVVTFIRQGIEGREIARKKYKLEANDDQMSRVGRELKFKLNISGIHTRLKTPTDAKPWYTIITAKNLPTYFEWRFVYGEDAVIDKDAYLSHNWRGKDITY